METERNRSRKHRVQQDLRSGQAVEFVFAPTPRDYSFKLNKKEKRAALKSALTLGRPRAEIHRS